MSDDDFPKPLTEDEARKRLLKHVWDIIDYWETESSRDTIREKLEGLAFSILSSLDGSSIELPKFIVAPDPHPEDKDHSAREGISWWVQDETEKERGLHWPENHDVDVNCDLGGSLHEQLYSVGRELGYIEVGEG